MVKNKDLEDALVSFMSGQLIRNDPMFASLADEDINHGKKIVTSRARVQIDEQYKLRLMMGNIIGYGYDFDSGEFEGHNVRELYKRAVANTKKLSGQTHSELFLAEQVKDNRFGIYMTAIR